MIGRKPSSHRRRRWGFAFTVTVLLATATLIGTHAPAQAQGVPDPELNSYVLFGFQELSFKGGQGNHGPSIIDGGNIGVNAPGFINGNDFRMNICSNAQIVMSDNTSVVSDTLRMGDKSTPTQECSVNEVFNNVAAPNNEQSRTGPAIPFLPPPVKAAPPFPTFTCDPANPVTVPAGTSSTLNPGIYGAVNVQNGGTLTLTAGTYTFCNFTTGQHVSVVTPPAGGVTIQTAQQFLFNDDMHFDGADCDTIPVIYVRGEGVSSNDNAVRFGQDSEVWGHFYVPTGRLNLGNQTDLHGTFWARAIGSDFNVDAEYCPPDLPEPPTGSISITKTVTGDTDGLPNNATFDVHYDCTIPARGLRNALDGTVTVTNGETITHTDVQVGTSCTITEVDVPDPLTGFVFDPPVVTPQSFIVTTAGQHVEVAIQNPLREVFGAIEVSKELTGDLDGYVPGTVFGFTLDCDDNAFDTTFDLGPGATFSSDPIRVGVNCTVSETGVPDPAPGFIYEDPVFTPASGRVTVNQANQTVTVEATNPVAENVGSIVVTKVVTGDTAGYIPGTEFGFSLDCDGQQFDATFTLADGDSFHSTDMPVGTTCEADETSVPDPADGFAWLDPEWAPDLPRVTITQAGQQLTITANNALAAAAPAPSTPPIPSPSTSPPGGGILPETGGRPPGGGVLPDAGGPPAPWLPAISGLVLIAAGTALARCSRRGRLPTRR